MDKAGSSRHSHLQGPHTFSLLTSARAAACTCELQVTVVICHMRPTKESVAFCDPS